MQVTTTQRKEQGAVFTTAPSVLVEFERLAGFTADPSIVYWEDSVGGGALATAIILAMYVDMEEAMPSPYDRTKYIFERRIYMNDIDQQFCDSTRKAMERLSKKLAGDASFECAIHISQADTVSPLFDPCAFWGFGSHRTITNRSYEQVSKLPQAHTRTSLRQAYQDKIYPTDKAAGKRFKVTDIGQYKAINHPQWLGGVDIRPKNIPKTLQTDNISVIDYSDNTRTMFSSHSGQHAAGIDVVVLQYGGSASGVTVRYGATDSKMFPTADSAWLFYEDLITHNYTTADAHSTLHKIISSNLPTIGEFCDVVPSGITLGVGGTIGDAQWRQKLLDQGVEEGAIVKHLPVGSICPGGFNTVDSKEYMLLPTQQHPVGLQYFYSLFTNTASSHKVPADKKAAYSKWIASYQISPALLLRYSADFSSSNSRGLAVGFAPELPGVGITGSVGFATSRTGSTQHLVALVTILHSSYGHFLKGMLGNQHNEQKTLVQGVSSKYKEFPVPDLRVVDIKELVSVGKNIILTNQVDMEVVDSVVYKLLPMLTAHDRNIIKQYVSSRQQ